MNIYSGCGKHFYKLSPFDKHRVGKFHITGDRRCLSTDEMVSLGFHINNKGVWSYGTFKNGIFQKGGAA